MTRAPNLPDEPVVDEAANAKAAPSRFATTLRALRHRNFQLFFSGQLISLVGTWMQSVAQAWLVYRLTGSALLLGAVGFSSQFPVFLVAPFGGIAADRMNRQRLVIATQTASMILAAILAWLTLSNRVHVWHIFVLAALLPLIDAVDTLLKGREHFAAQGPFYVITILLLFGLNATAVRTRSERFHEAFSVFFLLYLMLFISVNLLVIG